ncbi:heme-based aerotactic transducer HemAT [Oceanobacillus oncorhynchi subsp. incaldanensis]|uniref:Heme-based aerotactic transducer HemAT n=2 Tax=Oceanobacillus TaxID=182709 RepID=A0A0A1MJX9_9BACI|nr:globin-coupled sensor protein [Oceanobacillus oncorhynchi]MDM8099658.1 globin-coupled sensor protein [Oceanobacillus oncorhynchi]GIO19941.1 heme-based aerotactic transducer HemAT [Oceanobacillus oncorhynchi subsp. incaldanensis]CEI83393.1 Heme-based aerotactic transducer HemAT [Oceanobacillus oncorhynchi]
MRSIFRKDEREESLLESSKEVTVVLEKLQQTDLALQLKISRLTKQDLAVARLLKPVIQENIDIIIDAFYANLALSPELMDIIEDNSSVSRLKQTLATHVIEMFSGEINQAFIDKRRRIAQVHVHIGLQPKWYIASFQELFFQISKLVSDTYQDKENFLYAIQVVNKLLNFEQQIVLEAYEADIEEKRAVMDEKNQNLITSMRETAENLSFLSSETNQSVIKMVDQANRINQISKQGEEIAAATSESAQQGMEQTQTTNAGMSHLDKHMALVVERLEQLTGSAEKIKSVISIVESIAGQTNLLALNASIEAARVGEQGKGFAVVADEVRKLAEQSAKAVAEVSDLILETNEQVANSREAIRETQEEVTSVREQTAKTAEILRKVSESMARISQNSSQIQQSLEENQHSISEVESSMGEIENYSLKFNEME